MKCKYNEYGFYISCDYIYNFVTEITRPENRDNMKEIKK